MGKGGKEEEGGALKSSGMTKGIYEDTFMMHPILH